MQTFARKINEFIETELRIVFILFSVGNSMNLHWTLEL